jgi:hypothetical protein
MYQYGRDRVLRGQHPHGSSRLSLSPPPPPSALPSLPPFPPSLRLLFPPSLVPWKTSIFCPAGNPSTWAGAANPPSLPPSPRPCLPPSRTLFTTEGHVFFVDTARPDRGWEASRRSRGGDSREGGREGGRKGEREGARVGPVLHVTSGLTSGLDETSIF